MSEGSVIVSIPSAAATQYRRAARRLRSAYHRDPGRMHRALKDLAKSRDHETGVASSRFDWSKSAVLGSRDGRAWDFADRVADALEGPVLRYSLRRRLLKEAGKTGIGRFEANLIIAAVQNQMNDGAKVAPPAVEFHRGRLWLMAIACVLLELIAGWIAWQSL